MRRGADCVSEALKIAMEAVKEGGVYPMRPGKGGGCRGQIIDVVEEANPTRWREWLLSWSLSGEPPGGDVWRQRRDPEYSGSVGSCVVSCVQVVGRGLGRRLFGNTSGWRRPRRDPHVCLVDNERGCDRNLPWKPVALEGASTAELSCRAKKWPE